MSRATRTAVVRRKCGCGRPSGVAAECSQCTAQRMANVERVLASPGRPLDPLVRRSMEASFGRTGRTKPQRSAAGVSRAPLEMGRVDDPLELEADHLAEEVARDAGPVKSPSRSPGFDFGRVRIHTDARAADSARALDAAAYTVGDHVVFGAGRYVPGTDAGRKLLAHELAHVTQQSGDGPVRPKLRLQPAGGTSGRRGPGQIDLRILYQGCSDKDSGTLERDIVLARHYVTLAARAVEAEVGRKKGEERDPDVVRLLKRYFKIDPHPGRMGFILARLQGIQLALERGSTNWRCFTTAECKDPAVCTPDPLQRGEPAACAGLKPPVRICPPYFGTGVVGRIRILTHEAGHQAGLGLDGEVYEFEGSFPDLKASHARVNPDSYVAFVRAYAIRPVHRGTMSRVWRPEDMSAALLVSDPAIDRALGHLQGRVEGFKKGDGPVRNRLDGQFLFNVDGHPFPRPPGFTVGWVYAGITLIRPPGPGKPFKERILFRLFDKHPRYLRDRADPLDEKGEIVWREGGGVPLITEDEQSFDFTFTPADAGTLHFVVRMYDPGTATLLEFEDSIALQPTGSGGQP